MIERKQFLVLLCRCDEFLDEHSPLVLSCIVYFTEELLCKILLLGMLSSPTVVLILIIFCCVGNIHAFNVIELFALSMSSISDSECVPG